MPPVSRTPQHERRARTRAALLRAAGRVFAEHGYHRATLEDVTAAAGVSKGALYHYFPSKEQLFLALLEDRLGAGISEVEAVVAERGSDNEHLGAAMETFLRRINRDPRWLPLLLEFLAYGSPRSRGEGRDHREFLAPGTGGDRQHRPQHRDSRKRLGGCVAGRPRPRARRAGQRPGDRARV